MLRKNKMQVFIVLIVSVLLNGVSSAPALSSKSRFDPYHHEVVLGPDRNYTLEWRVDWKSRLIFFNISADCKGYIGMGLSKRGEIAGSDFVIGGVDSNSKPFISDMHGLADGTLQQDYHQDWQLIDANRSDGKTFLRFARKFDTCDTDDEDIPINDDLIHVIWIFGDTDEVTLFTPHIGTYPVYLLDPDPSEELALHYYRQLGPHSNLYLMQRWRVSTTTRLLPGRNTQVCSIVKGLPLTLRHFILGGGAYLPHEAKDHVRQIVLKRCTPPPGTNASEYFDNFSSKEGEECSEQTTSIPRQLCNEKIFIWGQGGRPFYFPEETGIPIGATPEEYFLLEVQYVNPDGISDLEIKAGFDLMIHPAPRQYEAGILTIGYKPDGQFVIPPGSSEFTISGHCSPQCTQAALPQEDFQVFAALIQMGSIGHKGQIRHFRNANELSWILKDGNYDNDFQQIRMLPKNSNVNPGDQLTLQCTFNSSNLTNGTYLGISEGEEQCVAHLFVNQAVAISECTSEYPSSNLLNRLGFHNFSRSITSPRRLGAKSSSPSPKPFPLSVETNALWTPKARGELQREMTFGSQTSSCPSYDGLSRNSVSPTRRGANRGILSSIISAFSGKASVTLPDISTEYVKPDECLPFDDDQSFDKSQQYSDIIQQIPINK